jgi:hypothetical protein
MLSFDHLKGCHLRSCIKLLQSASYSEVVLVLLLLLLPLHLRSLYYAGSSVTVCACQLTASHLLAPAAPAVVGRARAV